MTMSRAICMAAACSRSVRSPPSTPLRSTSLMAPPRCPCLAAFHPSEAAVPLLVEAGGLQGSVHGRLQGRHVGLDHGINGLDSLPPSIPHGSFARLASLFFLSVLLLQKGGQDGKF